MSTTLPREKVRSEMKRSGMFLCVLKRMRFSESFYLSLILAFLLCLRASTGETEPVKVMQRLREMKNAM